MAFDLPDRADAAFDAQARLFSNDVKALTQAAGLTGVKSGCGVTAQGSPNMTLAVAAGVIYAANAEVTVTGGNVTITTAHATWPRIDIVVVSSSGVKSVVAGSAAEFPLEPATPAGSVMLAQVYVPATDTAIGATQIRDRRITLQIPAVIGASTVVRKTADEPVTSSTVLHDDAQLLFAMTSNGRWTFHIHLFGQSAAGTALKINFSAPAGAVWRLMASSSGSTVSSSSDGVANDIVPAGSPATGANSIVIDGVVTTAATAGNFQVRWAQNVSSGTALKILANSYLEYRAL